MPGGRGEEIAVDGRKRRVWLGAAGLALACGLGLVAALYQKGLIGLEPAD